jgi:hypothetical protein
LTHDGWVNGGWYSVRVGLSGGWHYKDLRLHCTYQADIAVRQTVLLDLKSIEHILPIDQARTLTDLRLGGARSRSTRSADVDIDINMN